MTQIEQIKAELQKRLLKYDPDYTDAGQELQEMLAFVDSLPADSKIERKGMQKALSDMSAFIDSLPAESCLSECNFKEYLRGVFEANNGIENDPDLLVKLHASTLLELAQKELPDSPDFESEWQRYTASRKDDLQTNAVTMNVKEVAKHFAEWGAEHLKSNH